MRKSFTLIAFGIVFAAGSSVVSADNSLFSNVRVDSVFGPSATSISPPSRVETPSVESPTSLSDAGQLSRVLKEAGFETKEVGSRVVSTKKQLDPWSFPVVIAISEDESQLGIVLLLGSVKDESQLSNDNLLGLMAANRTYSPSHFGYNKERKRTELYHVVRNEGITAERLGEQIDRLAKIAKETDSLWQSESEAKPSTPPSSPPAAPQTRPTADLTGTWSAARSDNEAFAIQFEADGSFKLVYVKQGKQTRSKGKYTRSQETLTLVGEDGVRLTGTISNQTESQFELQLKNAASPLTFKKSS